ncbi:hypothetical protein Lesp02_31420 [Lentzea sp. NBRC 105346]|uniref:terpene synthase family protein n=1 Tax=Lentzea sp. NBRC 105346 TaxID=3032205 RepID=UPI0024A512EA|nr:terpene synthase family protein [Lentzea sp. NBRC 105346]GLZ30953.1 hypothetical protein Lesp02_31420 [Lentzea sp. NBRC 105346]
MIDFVVPYHPSLRFDMPIPYGGMNRHIWAAHDRMFDWLAAHGMLPSTGNLSVLKGSRCDLLTGGFYPNADMPTLVLLDQFMGWGFVLDDQIDDADVGLDRDRTAAVIAEFVDILNDTPPPRLTPAGTALADWWARLTAVSTEESWRRQFVHSTVAWLETMPLEARHWADGYVPGFDEYLAYRHLSIASWPYSDLCEIADHAELPGPVRELPAFAEMRLAMAHHVGLANDVISYEKQRDVGRQHDAITILCHETGCTPAEGLRRVVEIVNGYLADFVDSRDRFLDQVRDAGFSPEIQRIARLTAESLGTHLRAAVEWEILAAERFGDDYYYKRGNDPSVDDVLVHPHALRV